MDSPQIDRIQKLVVVLETGEETYSAEAEGLNILGVLASDTPLGTFLQGMILEETRVQSERGWPSRRKLHETVETLRKEVAKLKEENRKLREERPDLCEDCGALGVDCLCP